MAEEVNKKIPDLIEDHIYSPHLAENYRRIYADLESNRVRLLNELIWQVYRREITVEKFLADARNLQIPDFLNKIFPKILKNDFFLIADYLGFNVSDWLKYISGGIPTFEPIEKRATPAPFVPAIKLYEESAEKIFVKSDIKIAPELKNRFKTLVISGLKNVRKSTEVRERLVADIINGGMGLPVEIAEKILKLIEEGKKGEETRDYSRLSGGLRMTLNEVSGSTPSAGGQSGMAEKKDSTPRRDVGPQNKVKAPPINLPIAEDIKSKEVSSSPKTSADIRTDQSPTLKIVTPEKKTSYIEPTPVPFKIKPPVTEAIPQTPSGRAKVEDVVFRTRLIGPLEELSDMNLVDFHRLSPKPKVAIDKIRSKIELLASQGYAKRIQGIQSWQKSPINQLYVSILNEGIKQGAPIKQIIEERQKGGREILTAEEFQEIMRFNRSVHF